MGDKKKAVKGPVEMIRCDCGHSIPRKDWHVAKLCPLCGRDSSWITTDPKDMGLLRDVPGPTMA